MNELYGIIKEKLELPDDAVIYRKNYPRWDSPGVVFSSETRNGLEKIMPDAVYHFKNQPFILFFDFTREEAGKRARIIQEQVWCFDKAPVAFFIYENEVKILNAFHYQERHDCGESGLEEIRLENDEEKFKRFSFWELQSGNTWKWIQETFYKEGKKQKKKLYRVNQILFDNIKDLRKQLTVSSRENPNPLDEVFANILILRLIFIRYLIDRGVEIDETYVTGNTPEARKQCFNVLISNKQKLGHFFKYLKNRFNGNLFETSSEPRIDHPHLSILSRIFSSSGDQPFLFDVFDFGIIPVEVISGIYESVIDPDKRDKDSAVYTPPFMVDYILTQTVDEFLSNQPGKKECKILDPSCGSGIFLVQAYRKLVEKNRDKDNRISDENLIRLMSDHLFGVDKDPNALNVAAFSLYVALLDYKDPPGLKNFRLPILLETNLFEANFFDEDADFNNKSVFREKHFDFILGNPPWGRNNKEEHHINYINGHNVPTANFEIAQTFLARTKDFCNRETRCALIVTSKVLYNLSSKTKQEYLSLTEHSLDKIRQHNLPEATLLEIETLQNRIFPDQSSFEKTLEKQLSHDQDKKYRPLVLKHVMRGFKFYFLSKFNIDFLLDLSPVRREIFTEKNTPAMILFYRYAFNNPTNDNIIVHHSVKPNLFLKYFNVLVIEKQDRKKIAQRYFLEYDWMFKVALYGNTIDFHFLKKMLKQKMTINDHIEQDSYIIKGDGILRGTPKNDESSDFLIGMPVIENCNVRRFYSKVDTAKKLKKEDTYLEAGRSLPLFNGHHILLKSQTKNESEPVVSYTDTPVVFKHDVFGITTPKESDDLKLIYGLLISSLFTYYQYMTSSAWGVSTRPAIRFPEYLAFPVETIPDKVEFIDLVNRIIDHYRSNLSKGKTHSKILPPNNLLNRVNGIVNSVYKLNKMEEDMVDYTLEISRYQFQESKIDRLIRAPRTDELEQFARVFLDHFSSVYNGDGEYFQVNVYQMTYFVAMTFNIVPAPPAQGSEIVFPGNYTDESLLRTIARTFSIYEQSNKIFLQKDVKGFEEDYFYIIKPKEYKCWHRAMAYYDLAEFVKEIEEAELAPVTGTSND